MSTHKRVAQMVLGAALVAVAAGFAPTPASAQNSSEFQGPTITTSGEAIVRRAPDRAFIMATVESRARNPRDAQQQNAKTMTAVRQKIEGAGIDDDAVRTLGYTVQQEVDYVNGRRVPREYVARNTVEVRLDDIGRAGEILDLVVQAGATSVGDVRFDLRERAEAEREALRLAVVDARARADAAAAGAGVTIERVIRIDDSRAPVPPRPMMAMARMAADAAVETPIEAGDIEIQAQVTMTVAIR